MRVKKTSINMYLPNDLRDRLREIAKAEHRSMTNLCETIILRWLAEQQRD